MTLLELHGLGTRVPVTVRGERANEAVEALRRVWSRCLSARGGEIDAEAQTAELTGPLAPFLQGFTQQVTGAVIAAQRGKLFMFHAGAVTDPRTGAAVAYVAPGGTGKTTLSKVLGRTHGYVTDETVGFTPDGRILPYEKPLSVRPPDFAGVKDEMSPDELGLATVHPLPRLHRFVLISRDQSLAAPVVERLSVPDAILKLASESSSLSSLDRPLRTLASFLAARPPTLAVTYAEAEQVRDVLVDLLDQSAP